MPETAILDSLESSVFRASAALAGLQLDLFSSLGEGPLSARQIAESLGVETTRLRPLLYALVVVGLLSLEDGQFANSAEAAHFLVRGRPAYLGAAQAAFWSDMFRAALLTAESIRTGKPQAKHDYASMPQDELEEFLLSLYPWGYGAGICLAENYGFASYDNILDAAGGSGVLAIALCEALPRLRALVVDLPNVAEVARRVVARSGAGDRIQVKAVDLVRQPLEGPFDAAVIKSFLQTLSLQEAGLALRNIHQALKPGGDLYVWEWPLDDSRLAPEDMALVGTVFVSIYDHGQKLTVGEYRDLLAGAGFEGFAMDDNCLITARKPAAAS